MSIEEMKLKLKNYLKPKRFAHSVKVMETAVRLSLRYGRDTGKAEIAGLLHDCARGMPGGDILRLCGRYGIKTDYITEMQPELLHGPVGSRVAKEDFGVDDREILDSIYWHTTGHADMGMLEKIIFIADYTEPGRHFPGVEEIRTLAFTDIDRALVAALEATIRHVMSRGALLHPETVNARNFIIASFHTTGGHNG